MRKLLFGMVFLIPLITLGQNQQSNEIFPRYGNFEKKGWTISPSANYMLPTFKKVHQRYFMEGDSVYDISFNTKGKLGFGFEVGRFKAIETSRVFSYIDYSLGLKILNGREDFAATLKEEDSETPFVRHGGGKFSQSYITGSFNATHASMIGKYLAQHHTIGINADYKFAEVYEYTADIFPMELHTPGNILIQAHYKVGLSYKLTPNIMVLPSLETPIVTFYEFDDLKSTHYILNSRYRPIILRLTLLIMDSKPNRECPQVNKPRKKNETLFGTKKNRAW